MDEMEIVPEAHRAHEAASTDERVNTRELILT